ncbi:jg14887 [Pararge aegeria aegeria]|uniref:Jg14887 protein n=1 Tax=Pararge aegeria aegeria TaxID=348720 RepID=A0A8S4R150_9NEOP|nr:jg14887 [Pararge aegeria aegeria]
MYGTMYNEKIMEFWCAGFRTSASHAACASARPRPLARTSWEIASRSPQSGSNVVLYRRVLAATLAPREPPFEYANAPQIFERRARGENSELVVRSWPSRGRDRSRWKTSGKCGQYDAACTVVAGAAGPSRARICAPPCPRPAGGRARKTNHETGR